MKTPTCSPLSLSFLAFVIVSLSIANDAFAQSANKPFLDSLEGRVISAADDSARLEVLFSLVSEYEKDNPVKVLVYGQQLLDLAQNYADSDKIIRTNYFIGKAYNEQHKYKLALDYLNASVALVSDSLKYETFLKFAYFEKGFSHLLLREYTSARVFFQSALSIFEKQRNKWNIAKTEYRVGEAYLGEGDVDRAIVFFKRNERSYDRLKYVSGVIEAMVKTGMTYLNNGDDNLALSSFKKAISRAERSKKSTLIAKAKKYLAKFYYEKGFYRECYKWQKEALADYQTAHDTIGYAQMLSATGLTLIEIDDIKSGFEKEIEALGLFQLADSKADIAVSLNNLGKHYVSLAGTEQAIEYLKEAAQINLGLNDKEAYVENELNLGYLYFQQKAYDLTLQHAQIALLAAKDGKLTQQMQRAALLLSKTYQQTNQFEKAIEAQNLFDSLYVEASNNQMNKIANQAETNKSKYENEAARMRAAKVYKYLFWTILPLFIAVLGLGIFFLYENTQLMDLIKDDQHDKITTKEFHIGKRTIVVPISIKNTDNTRDIEEEEEEENKITPEVKTELKIEERLVVDDNAIFENILQSTHVLALQSSNETATYALNEARLQVLQFIASTEDDELKPESLLKSIIQFHQNKQWNAPNIMRYFSETSDAEDTKFSDKINAIWWGWLIQEYLVMIQENAFSEQLDGLIRIEFPYKLATTEKARLKISHTGKSIQEHTHSGILKHLKAINLICRHLKMQSKSYQLKQETFEITPLGMKIK